PDADRVLVEAVDHARAARDPRLEARARVEQERVRLQAESSERIDDARRVADAALQVLADHRDELGQCRAWWLRAWIEWIGGRSAGADEAWRRAAAHARRAGDERELFEI